MIVMWFSRRREYRADAGGAKLAGRGAMISALQGLQRAHRADELPQPLARVRHRKRPLPVSGGCSCRIRRSRSGSPRCRGRPKPTGSVERNMAADARPRARTGRPQISPTGSLLFLKRLF